MVKLTEVSVEERETVDIVLEDDGDDNYVDDGMSKPEWGSSHFS